LVITPGKAHAGRISGMACVSNFGAYANWTGHVLAGSPRYRSNPYRS
jgi:alpha-glucuronidase